MTALYKEIQKYFNEDPFESTMGMVDYLNNLFFNYKDDSKQFISMKPKDFLKLPFTNGKNIILHYGGDYIVTGDHKNENIYNFYFMLPGHNKDTVEVIKRDQALIIKSKDQSDEEESKEAKPLSNYKFYKRVPLVKKGYEVSEVVFKDGILTIRIEDKQETESEQRLEITQQ